MEKKKALKTVKILILATYLLVFLVILVFEVQARSIDSEFSVSYLFYWMILFGWLGLIWNFKWGASASLAPAFILFIMGALLTTLGLREIGETVMRVSFVGWIIGIGQALLEYRQKLQGTRKYK